MATRSPTTVSTWASPSPRSSHPRRRCCHVSSTRRTPMDEFLLVASAFVLTMVGISLVPILRGPGDAERMMAAQLVGSAGIAGLLLAGTALGTPATADVALMVALLATFSAIAFVKRGTPRSPDVPEDEA